MAQGTRHFKPLIDNRLAAKLRTVEDALHLVCHIMPESWSELLTKLQQALNGAQGSYVSQSVDDPGDSEEDTLYMWHAGQVHTSAGNLYCSQLVSL